MCNKFQLSTISHVQRPKWTTFSYCFRFSTQKSTMIHSDSFQPGVCQDLTVPSPPGVAMDKMHPAGVNTCMERDQQRDAHSKLMQQLSTTKANTIPNPSNALAALCSYVTQAMSTTAGALTLTCPSRICHNGVISQKTNSHLITILANSHPRHCPPSTATTFLFHPLPTPTLERNR